MYSIEEIDSFSLPDGGRFKVGSVEEAYNFCKKVTLKHYENFPVASLLIPEKQRTHIFPVYTFARIADDIADEASSFTKEERLLFLNKFASLLNDEPQGNPVFTALSETIKATHLPFQPFENLIQAFKMDVDFKQPETWDDVTNYCRFSANPVGEIILRLFGLYNESTAPLSDKICTGLQLANFWQDLSIDLQRGRCYIPTQILQKHNLSKEDLLFTNNSVNLSNCFGEILSFTYPFFEEGKELLKFLKPYRLKLEIKATVEGGLSILNKADKMGINTIKSRPKLLFYDIVRIFLKSIF